MARVLLVSPLFPPSSGGVQHLMEQIVTHSSHEIHVLTEKREEANDEKYEFEITRMELRKSRGTFNLLKFLFDADPAFDVVYFSRLSRKPFELLCSIFYPTLCHAHGTELTETHLRLDSKFPFHRVRTGWRKAMYRLGMHRIDRFIAVSEWTKNQLMNQGVPESSIRIIHPGVDFSRFSAGECQHSGISPDPDKLTLLTVARLDPRKGHNLVIRAIKDLPEIEYFIAGDGRAKGELETLVEELSLTDRVTFLGYVDDERLPSVYDCCDVFIMPGSTDTGSVEGFGMAYIEANAAGKPVIGSGIEGMTDAINPGETGWFVTPDETGIQEAISTIDLQEVSQMKDSCQEWAKEHDWKQVVSAIDKEIDGLT